MLYKIIQIMKTPQIAIIEDEPGMTKLTRDIISKQTPYRVKTFNSYEEFNDSSVDADAFLIDIFLDKYYQNNFHSNKKELISSRNGLEIATQIRSVYKDKPIAIMTSWDNEESEETKMKAFEEKLIDAWITKTDNLAPLNTQIPEVLERFREKGKLYCPATIGIYGIGRMGTELIKNLQRRNWTKKIKAHSPSRRGDYSDLENLTTIRNPEKVHYAEKVEDLLDTDFLVLSTGPRGINYKNKRNSDEMITALLQGVVQKLEDDFYRKQGKNFFRWLAEEEYPGTLVIESNLQGPLIQWAISQGIDPRKITGFTSDTRRAQYILKQQISQKSSEQDLPSENILINVYGAHGGGEVTEYEKARVLSQHQQLGRAVPIREFLPEIKDPLFRKKLQQEQISMGRKIMLSSEHERTSYTDTPIAIEEGLDSLVHLKSPEFPAYLSSPKHFNGTPLQIPINLNIDNFTLSSNFSPNFLSCENQQRLDQVILEEERRYKLLQRLIEGESSPWKELFKLWRPPA